MAGPQKAGPFSVANASPLGWFGKIVSAGPFERSDWSSLVVVGRSTCLSNMPLLVSLLERFRSTTPKVSVPVMSYLVW